MKSAFPRPSPRCGERTAPPPGRSEPHLPQLFLSSACETGPSLFEREAEGDAPAGAAQAAPALPASPPAEVVSRAEPALSSLPEGPAALLNQGRPHATAPLRTPYAQPAPGMQSPMEPSQDSARGGIHAMSKKDATERFPRPEHVRGLYLTAWTAGSDRRLDDFIALAGRTEINAFVMDIKDASGYVSHRTGVPLAHEAGATGQIRIRDLGGLLSRLEEAGIYPVARIVIVKDPVLAAARPDLAVQDTGGGVWTDKNGIVWLNPFNREVWDYHIALAREAAAMGFPEIQWDYVRFPDAPAADLARAGFPGRNGRLRSDAIRSFLERSRAALSVFGARVTADVFGVTTTALGDVGIGQVWESFIDVVDVALPMVYPSHYWQGSFGFDAPNAYPYEIVRRALDEAVRRSARVEGAGATRPWLQDFSLGNPPYGSPRGACADPGCVRCRDP